MSATDELRRMLDERGVEWKDYGYENHTWWSDGNGIGWHAENRLTSNGPFVKIDGVLTPEQAIAATLGSEFNLDGLPVGLTISDDSNLLNWRGENYVKQSTLGSGTLTAEQVRKAIFDSSSYASYDGAKYYADGIGMQAIADELNSRAELGSEPPYDELLRCLENDWHIRATWDGLRKFWCIELTEEGMKLRDATLGREVNGKTSDGYHTFDELYYHRAALFACLVSRIPRHQAFKSWKHSDGSMYDGYFIAGIYTERGWCTYHCKKEWWPLFDCQEVPSAPVWDGHTPSDAIHRLMSEFLPEQIVNGEVC